LTDGWRQFVYSYFARPSASGLPPAAAYKCMRTCWLGSPTTDADYQQQASDNARGVRGGRNFQLSSAQSSSPRPRPRPSMHTAMRATSHQRRVLERISPPKIRMSLPSRNTYYRSCNWYACCRKVPHLSECLPPLLMKCRCRLDSSGSLRQPTPLPFFAASPHFALAFWNAASASGLRDCGHGRCRLQVM